MSFAVVAAGLDWLEGLLPALFVGFWILSQVFALFRRAPQGRDPVVVVKPVPPVPPVLQPVPTRDLLQKEIEEFLVGRRSGRPQSSEQQEAPADRQPDQRPRRRAESRRGRTAGKPPRGADSMAPPPPAPVVTTVAQPPVIDTDIARHVDQAFSHDLAHAAPLSLNEKVPAPPPQGGRPPLVASLRDPETIRQIVVLREVLERPTERW